MPDNLNLESLKLEPCVGPWWATNGHMQTLSGHFLPSPRLENLGTKIEVPLPDGDRLVSRIIEGKQPIVLYLFHGLGGHLNSHYMHRTAQLAQRKSFTVILTNHRGCGEGEGFATHPYHSGRGEDLSAVIAMGRERYPSALHLAVGFSLSGNALLVLSSRHRGNTLPDAAIAVNAPINPERCAHLLKSGVNRIYDLKFIQDMRKTVISRQRQGRLRNDLQVQHFMTLHDFDNLYTAPEGGFRNREHYYSTCSAQNLIQNIQIPTILLTAADDPFVNYQDYIDAKRPKNVGLHIEKTGGHMGYISRRLTPLGSYRWLDYALDKFLNHFSNSLAGLSPQPNDKGMQHECQQ